MPRLLDAFCGAGGCAAGYVRAGFTVVGVDHRPQPNYLRSGASEFVQADALDFIRDHGREFDAVHASPPCQRYSAAAHIGGTGRHPDLIPPVRELLEQVGRPWVIENVPGSPLNSPAEVCGLSLGLGVKRHRWFEASFLLFGTGCRSHRSPDWVTVFGGGAPRVADNRRRASAGVARRAMGIDWMTRDELAQAIPPAYTHWVGRQVLALLGG